MTATYLGSLTLGDALPGSAAAAAVGSAALDAALPSLSDQLAGLLAFTPEPVDVSAAISDFEGAIVGARLSISLGLPVPSLATQLASIAQLISALQTQVAHLQAQLGIVLELKRALGAAGVHALAFEGPVANFGSEVTARLAEVPGLSPADPAHAITLITTIPSTWAAMAQLFKVAT